MDFEVNLKGSEGEVSALAEKKIKLFNADKPEGNYALDMEVVYDKIIL